MRIYENCTELMSETGRNLWEMGVLNAPKTYQNQKIEGREEFQTKELICEQYCLTVTGDTLGGDIAQLFQFSDSRDWADAEFQERVSGRPINPGTAWAKREEVWADFLEFGDKFGYTYAERFNMMSFKGMTKLQIIIDLLKKDPDTRKAILDVYGVGYTEPGGANLDHSSDDFSYLDGSRRIPCTMYYDFLIRKNQKGEPVLNLCYHQRSSDFVTHFGNDVYLALKLKNYVASQVGVKEGYLYHTIDSLHAYKKDWAKLKNMLN